MNKLLFVVLILVFSSVCLAAPADTPPPAPPPADSPALKTIGIFFEAPLTYANNERIRAMVPEKTVPMFPKQIFNVLPFEETSMAVRTYREDNRMMSNPYYPTPMNRSDIQKIGKELNCDYVLWVKVLNGPPRIGAGLFSISASTTINTDVRLLNIETAKYLISKEIVKDGKSTAIYMGMPSFENAYIEALEKAFAEFVIPKAMLLEMSMGLK